MGNVTAVSMQFAHFFVWLLYINKWMMAHYCHQALDAGTCLLSEVGVKG